MPNLSPTVHRDKPGRVAAGIAVRGLGKSFDGEQVLKGVDLDVAAGKFVALVGPSGCGKTTLLRCIAGLESVDAGEVRIGSTVVSDAKSFIPPERRHVGMVFQDDALFPHMTVGANVGFGLPRGERRASRVEEALALVGLVGHAGRKPDTLSGGQQQRVALARALAHRPSAILLDEPFASLDASLRSQIRADTKRLLEELGVSALFVTHLQEEALLVGEEVAVMLGGVVVQQAPPDELYAAPASRGVARFVGDANLVPGHAQGEKAEIHFGRVPLRTEAWGEVDVLVRPEQVSVLPGSDATVTAVEFYGHDGIYVVKNGDGELRVRFIGVPEFRPGECVALLYTGPPTVAYTRISP